MFRVAFFTSEAVIKKFHGSSVPRPRMKKMIPTKQPLQVGGREEEGGE